MRREKTAAVKSTADAYVQWCQDRSARYIARGQDCFTLPSYAAWLKQKKGGLK